MRDRRAEEDGLAVVRLFLPMTDNGVVDGCAVHDAPDLSHVEVVARFFDLGEFVAHPDIDHECARRHEVTAADEFSQPDLVGDVGEYRAQALAIAAIGRRRHTKDVALGILLQDAVDNTAVAIGRRVMRLIDHEEIKLRHGVKIGCARERWNHGEGHLAPP